MTSRTLPHLLALCLALPLFTQLARADTLPDPATKKEVPPLAFVQARIYDRLKLADFTLTGTAKVEDTRGGTLDVFSGQVALSTFEARPYQHIRAEQNHFILSFDRPGTYPVRVRFTAAVNTRGSAPSQKSVTSTKTVRRGWLTSCSQ